MGWNFKYDGCGRGVVANPSVRLARKRERYERAVTVRAFVLRQKMDLNTPKIVAVSPVVMGIWMVLQLVDRDMTSVGRHSFRAASFDPNSSWLEDSATEYRRLLTEFSPPLKPIPLDGIDILDVSALKSFFAGHLIPPFRGKIFDAVRSDFGEVLSYMVLENHYATEIALKSVRDRERTDCPARGIDIVGFETKEKLCLIIGECKVSDDITSPPKVVDKNKDCLRVQLTKHVSQKDETIRKLTQLARRASSQIGRDRLLAAILYWQENRWDLLEIVCCPLLIRSHGVYRPTDFGSLMSDDAGFENTTIRFIILVTPEPIDETIRKWYDMVKLEVS